MHPDPALHAAFDPADALAWWPRAALGRALALLAGRSDAAVSTDTPADDEADLSSWTAWACDRLDIRLDRRPVLRADLAAALEAAAPALVWHPSGDGFLLLVGRGRVLAPDGARHRIGVDRLAKAMVPPPHPSLLRQGRRVAALVGGGAALAEALCAADAAGAQVSGLWRLRPAPHATRRAIRHEGLLRYALASLALAFAAQGAEVFLWGLLGAAALSGQAPAGAWLVLLLALAPVLQLSQSLTTDALSRRIAGLVRRRLLAGALCLPDMELRAEGPEGLLSRGMEAQGIETALSALATSAPLALAALGWAVWVLAQGPLAFGLVPLLGAVLVAQAMLFRHFVDRFALWMQASRRLTTRMVSWMIGHRSLSILGTPEEILSSEATGLSAYAEAGKKMDHASLGAFAVLPNGWSILAVAALALVAAGAGAVPQRADMAITLGGILLSARALVSLSGTWAAYAAVRVGLVQMAPLWRARPAAPEARFPPLPKSGTPRLAVQDLPLVRPERGLHLSFRFPVPPKARLWLTGPSGSGKSSLLRLLAKGDTTGGGHVLSAAGPVAPRHAARAVAMVPQFHDNHVLDGSFAFNLLLSRRWPPKPADLEAAENIARQLGLGDLVDRMPAGLFTQLGETGWQLSQGERSRMFLARALLQNAPVVALDESLAALDPETELVCLAELDRVADALVLVRHG
nr:ATP-binding cassette domain-containing protein [Gemmobacter straminiformis]